MSDLFGRSVVFSDEIAHRILPVEIVLFGLPDLFRFCFVHGLVARNKVRNGNVVNPESFDSGITRKVLIVEVLLAVEELEHVFEEEHLRILLKIFHELSNLVDLILQPHILQHKLNLRLEGISELLDHLPFAHAAELALFLGLLFAVAALLANTEFANVLLALLEVLVFGSPGLLLLLQALPLLLVSIELHDLRDTVFDDLKLLVQAFDLAF